jgi:exosortase E/protease (VPEID-CTERM system)
LLHLVAFSLLAALSACLYDPAWRDRFVVVATGWVVAALGVVVALFAVAAPLRTWLEAFSRYRTILGYAIFPAIATVVAIHWSQALWHPAAELTFRLIVGFLSPFVPAIYSDAATTTLGTPRFAVSIADECSGLEGMGLMAIFCASWLWFFRREFRFPRALVIIPIALLLIFLLNILRISALLLIGDAGYTQIAVVGFHSQAGWIAFNTAAIAVAIVTKRTAWFARSDSPAAAAVPTRNLTAAFLMPLLGILASGMLVHALSAGFDFLYPAKLLVGGCILWIYRADYATLNWRFGWRGIGAGLLVCVSWIAWDHWFNAPQGFPAALSGASSSLRAGWIACRVLAAVITVPLAEELAYRGFLMRRFVSEEFERVEFKRAGWFALLASSVIFGVSHGAMWLPGIGAGLGFGLLAVRTGKIGEAVAAHAVANAGIAAYVLCFDQWQLW